MRIYKRRALPLAGGTIATIATTAMTLLAAQAQAQTPTPAGGIEDIVVTARRTNEQLQRTPVTITALTTESLRTRQIVDVTALQQTTPGLVVKQNHSGVGLSLRGQVQTSSDSSVDQSVGLYVDGVYVARQMAGRFDMLDIERIEVLHGPQGTLFGRNTTGGAISIITNKPSDLFEGSIVAGIGNFDRREVTGVVNVPVSEFLSARVAGRHVEHDGFGRNTFLNRDVGNDNYDQLRGSLAFQLGEGTSLLVQGELVDRRSNGPTINVVDFIPSLEPELPSGFYEARGEVPSVERIKLRSTSATLESELSDAATLRSITAYRQTKFYTLTDFDNTPIQQFDNISESDIRQFSQELQVFGKLESLDWIAGVFYFNEHGPENYYTNRIIDYISRIRQKSYAGYGQLTYHLTNALRVTGGLRYTKDQRHLVAGNTLLGGCFMDPAVLNDPSICRSSRDLSNNYLSYTASVDYQALPNLFLYARTGMGRKSGGFNKTGVSLSSFSPEKVTDYEVGFKADLLDRHLRVNGAAYISFYKNMQRPITSDTSGQPTFFTQSVGKARILGGEIEVTAIPVDNLELSGNIGVTQPKYLDFVDATGDRSDEPFTQVSKFTWTVGGTYKIPASFGIVSLHADYSYQSAKYFFPNPTTRQPAYGLLNGRIGFDLEGLPVEISVWGRNLTKKRYYTDVMDFRAAVGVSPAFPGEPRTYGMTVGYRFGSR